MRLLLIRHGQTPSNVDGLLDTARPGPGLTELGERQAAEIPDALKHEAIDGIYVSVLRRTLITATPLIVDRGLDPVEIRRANEAIAPVPDLIAIFDLPVEEALARIRRRAPDGPNLFEREDQLTRAQQIFDSLEGFPRIVRLDATRPPEELEQVLRAEISRGLA